MGGSCFPKDVEGLIKISAELGYEFDLLKEVGKINSEQTVHFLDRLSRRLGGFEGKCVALMGLAFKPNTDDIRDAKSLAIIERVIGEGGFISAYDPVATANVRQIYPDLNFVEDVYDVSENADALVLVTEWNEFKAVDLARLRAKMAQPVLFDGQKIYGRPAATLAGFEYYAIGVASDDVAEDTPRPL